MLDEKDIQIIKELLNEQETRLTAKIEGKETLLETMAPKSRLEAVEDELALLKTVVSSLNKDVEALKKAIKL